MLLVFLRAFSTLKIPGCNFGDLSSYSCPPPLLKIWAHSDKGPSPSPYVATPRALVQAAFCMAMFLYLSPSRPLSWFTDPAYQEWGFWRKLSYQYMSGFTMRWKYYFIWSISEAAMVISGLGFSGWTESSPPKPKWDRAKVVDILGFELAKSSVLLPLVLNIQVSTWLRHWTVSWVHHTPCSVSFDDCWFKSYLPMGKSYTHKYGSCEESICRDELCLHSFGSELLLCWLYGYSLSLVKLNH
ncbi:hypothetical protein ERO13_A01G000301v2 [Gossypium hirsutum]|nr:hypothetical protein ERO13_A01G000301v2 [Gossypium hirsutum]